jgi:serine/threonine-protein kinase
VSVTSVSVESLRQVDPTSATATVNVSTTTTGTVTLTLTWYASNTKGTAGKQNDAVHTFNLKGRTAYTITDPHTFNTQACYWGVAATTNPEADNGSSWQQILTRQCQIQ